jgi:iron(III) transport system permease protein
MYEALYPDFGQPNFGIAAVYGMQLIIPLLIILYFYQKVLKSAHRYAAVTGKGYKPKWVALGRMKWLGIGFVGLYFLLVFFLPFLTMLWASFAPYFQLPSMDVIQKLGLNAYRSGINLIWNKQALTNTLLLMFFVGLFSVTISFAISWIVIRSRLPGKYALDSIAMMPQALPRAALAIVVLYIALSVVKIVPFYGTVIILIIANTISYIPFTTRTITSAFIQIHRELEEAAQVAGGSVWVTIRRIVVPVILPALIFAFIWTALLAYREVTMALFLIGPKNIVLASEIWTLWDQSDIVTAAAIGVMMVLIGGIILFAVMSLFPRVFRERVEI